MKTGSGNNVLTKQLATANDMSGDGCTNAKKRTHKLCAKVELKYVGRVHRNT